MHNATYENAGLRGIRRVLLALLFFGLVAVGTELVFLDHFEDWAQRIPLVLIAVVVVVLAWDAVRRSRISLRALQASMVMLVLAGPLGIALHYQGNTEFQREIDPSIGGGDLFWKAMKAKAPPALAPGAMAQLGLLGLAYGWARHHTNRRMK